MKKILTLILCNSLIVACATSQKSEENDGLSNKECIEKYKKSGVMKGYMKREINPDGTIKYTFTETSPCEENSKEKIE